MIIFWIVLIAILLFLIFDKNKENFSAGAYDQMYANRIDKFIPPFWSWNTRYPIHPYYYYPWYHYRRYAPYYLW